MQAPAHTSLHLSALRLLHDAPRWLLAPIPLVFLQPIFDHIAAHVAAAHPDLFVRLGRNAAKRFLIDPIDLPFVLVLIPTTAKPYLKAYRRHDNPKHDAGIGGTFFNLLDMLTGTLDGDALFFTRDLRITGDVEAVVALRNALDDFDGNIVDVILSVFGPFSKAAALGLSALRPTRTANRNARRG